MPANQAPAGEYSASDSESDYLPHFPELDMSNTEGMCMCGRSLKDMSVPHIISCTAAHCQQAEGKAVATKQPRFAAGDSSSEEDDAMSEEEEEDWEDEEEEELAHFVHIPGPDGGCWRAADAPDMSEEEDEITAADYMRQRAEQREEEEKQQQLPQGYVVHDITKTHFADLTHTCDLCSRNDDDKVIKRVHAKCTVCAKTYCQDCYTNTSRAFTEQGRDTSTCPFCMQSEALVVQLVDSDDDDDE